MSDVLLKGEFDARMGGIEKLIAQRFDQNDATNLRIEAKVDKTNGRVTAGEIKGAEHEAKIRNLEATVFRSGRKGRPDDEMKGLTRRDVAMFVAGGTALAAATIFIWKILPFLLLGPKP